jgi:hypothetical protein|tara:strand:+ start:1791 stop:3134 length:1344 start_codon:yes stop_codon:yes gene_type:complete
MLRRLIILLLIVGCGLAITTEDIYDDSYALIIGIDKYQNVQSLDYAVNDAKDIQNMLVGKFQFPKDNIRLLINEEATQASILQEFSNITKKAESNDRVLIFFAGHGMTDDLPDGGEMGYLLPIKAKRDELFTTSIPMDDLKRISSMSKSKHMLFLIDACYGGLAATGARGLSSTTPNYIDKITKDKSRQIITAGGRGEQVIEKSEWGHSAFTLNLIRALEDGKADLNDDGYITAEELGLFLKEKVSIDSDNQQTPVSRRFTSQEGEFVFISKADNVILSNNEKVVINEASIDYDVLTDKLAEKLKTEKDLENKQLGITKTYLNDKPRSINIGLGSQRSITFLSFSQNVKSWENNTLFITSGIGASIIGIGLSNKTLNLNGIIGLDGSSLSSEGESFTFTYFVSFIGQANLGRNWLFDYGLGFGNYKSTDDNKMERTIFPIISFEYVF